MTGTATLLGIACLIVNQSPLAASAPVPHCGVAGLDGVQCAPTKDAALPVEFENLLALSRGPIHLPLPSRESFRVG
jgi:hypothetical protein